MMLLIALILFTAPQDTLTLSDAYRSAYEYYPRMRELRIARDVRDLKNRNLDARYLPSFSIGGQAVYQSDVPSIQISAPGVALPTVKNDQYRLGVTVDQLIYDGGKTSAQKGIEDAASALAQQEVMVSAYGLREQVEAAWFGALMSEAEMASIGVLEEDLAARLGQAQALVDRGVSTSSNAQILEAELIKVRQQFTAAESRRRAGLDVLEELTGWSISNDAQLSLTPPDPGRPDVPLNLDLDGRPETVLYDLSRQILDRQATLASRRTRPKITSFVDAAVGRPQGLDFFQNDIGPFVSLGVRIGWSFWDWNSPKRDRQVLSLQSESVGAREEAFRQQIRAAAARIRRDIEQLEANLDGDADIVALRGRISDEARSRLDNGVITATDFLVERNAEHRARLEAQIHRIQLAQARARLVTILGAK